MIAMPVVIANNQQLKNESKNHNKADNELALFTDQDYLLDAINDLESVEIKEISKNKTADLMTVYDIVPIAYHANGETYEIGRVNLIFGRQDAIEMVVTIKKGDLTGWKLLI